MKKPKNFLEWANRSRNTCKFANKLMTDTSGEVNLQSKQDIICRVRKVKSATSTHHKSDVLPFLAYVIFPLNPTLR